MKKYVFDSSALICYLDGESNAEKIAELFEEISENEHDAYLCVVNLGEIYYHFLRTGGHRTANIALQSIHTLPLYIIDADTGLTLEAAKIKAFNKMSYADCFAAATTSTNKAMLVTSDKEFKQVENEIKIHWV